MGQLVRLQLRQLARSEKVSGEDFGPLGDEWLEELLELASVETRYRKKWEAEERDRRERGQRDEDDEDEDERPISRRELGIIY